MPSLSILFQKLSFIMVKVSHRTLVILSGLVWSLIGAFLFSFGIFLILKEVQEALPQKHYSPLAHLSQYFPDPKIGIPVLITAALLVGYLKGKYVLGKSVARQVHRIYSFAPPISLKYLYSPGYYFLIGGMCALGISMRYLPIAIATRGAVDIAIGSALLQGAILYFRTNTRSMN